MLRMNTPVCVKIIAAPIACKEGVKDSWRDVAKWTADQLKGHFGEAVETRYFDLFDADCPPVPVNAQLPLIVINGEVLTSGGKISVPAIRRKIETIVKEHPEG
jgi:hypothetical protein